MANSIDLVTKFLPLIDEVYKKEAKSAVLEAPSELVQQTQDANTVKIAKLAMVGLGNYDKEDGYPDGDVTLSWETHAFANDRGRRFSVDRMDDTESFGLTAGRMVGEYLRTYVIPEIDAYRFAKIATKATQSAEATLTGETAKAAIDTGIVTLQENEVDDSRMIIFATPTVAQSLSDNIIRTTINGDTNINNIIETYNGIPLVRVPQSRFYTQVTLDAGATSSAGGYSKTASTGADINFIVMDKNASFNITKLYASKLFSPDVNQNKDAWQFDFRAYHDSFVFDNKVKGIYLHKKKASA
jgi:hypothetical protein